MQRIAVIGTAGSGKSTLAASLAETLGHAHLELDAVHWRENWTRAAPEVMRAEVAEFMSRDRWVIDGNYRGILGNQVLDGADTVIWTDPGRSRMLLQSVRRAVRRAVTREELWNGNREPRGDFFLAWRDHSILTWLRALIDMNRTRYTSTLRDPDNAHLAVVRLHSRAQVEQLLCQVRRRQGILTSPPGVAADRHQ